MAHNLWIEANKAHMMYVGKLPWHGLGTPLDEPATSAEAIRAAGLDWNVRKVPIYAIDGPGVVPIPRYCGVVPEDRWGKPDCPVFGVVGREYQPLQNVEAFEFFDSIVGQKAAVYHTAGALGKGEQIWILAKLPGMMEITQNDQLEKYVLLNTGHDGRTCVRIILTPVRVVCQNTLTLALQRGDEIARAYHTRDLDRQLDAARHGVLAMMNGFQEMESSFKRMAAKRLDTESAKEYLKRVFPAPKQATEPDLPGWITEDRERCLRLFRDGMGNDDPAISGTLWAAYNGVTEYVDHWRDRGCHNHMQSVCFGRGFNIKTLAYQEAHKMVAAA